jgi:hypothetical protein
VIRHDTARRLVELGLIVVPAALDKAPGEPGLTAEAPGLTLDQIANREAVGAPNRYSVIIGRTDIGLRSGVADIDTDVDKATGEMVGEASLAAVAEMPPGPWMQSPSGGRHRLVRAEIPEGHEFNCGPGLLEKVDAPWHFVAVDEGRVWHDLDLPIPQAPAPLLEHLTRPRAARCAVEPGSWDGAGFGTDAAVAFLESYCDKLRAAPEGHWNNTLFLAARWAGELVSGGTLDPDWARDAIFGAMDDADEMAAVSTFESGWKAGLAAPRVLSEDMDPVTLIDEAVDDLEAFLAGAVTRVDEILTRPPVEWWPGLEGLLQKGVTSEIVAASGGGKSLWTLQHCVDLAQRGVRVLYCALEGQAGFTGRLKAQIQERCVNGLPGVEDALMEAMQERLFFYNLRVALSGGDVARRVADLRRTAEGIADIVVIDTLIRAAPGVDENDNAQMQGIVDSADLLRYREGMSVWLIRHAGHDQNRGRGASSVYAALDNSVFISPIGNHDGKDGRPLIVRVRADKVKDGRQAHGLVYKRHELVIGTLHDGSDWTSVVFRPEHDLDEDQNADWTTVLSLIDENTDDDGIGMTAAQIKAATQWTSSKAGRVLKDMVESNRVNRSKEGKGSFIYSR